MDWLNNNRHLLAIIGLLVIIGLLLLDAMRQRGGAAQVWQRFVARLRCGFERNYLALLLDTQCLTPALLVKGEVTSLELLRAFAMMHMQIEGATERDAGPSDPRHYDHMGAYGWLWPVRLWRRWRARNEPLQPPTTPGGAIWQYQRLVIRGKPGSGKTTLLKHIAITCARELCPQKAQQRGATNGPIASTRNIYGWPRPLFPIFIPLRRLARACPDWEHTPSLLDAYERGFGQIYGTEQKPPSNWFKDRLRRGGCLLLIDGFDELRDELRRDHMAQLIRDLERLARKRPNYIIVTTRPIGYENQLDSRFTLRELAPLSPREADAMVHARYAAIYERESDGRRLDWTPQEKAERLTSRLGQSASLQRLASNPLMLGLIIGIHHRQEDGELPQERYRVYELAVEYLTERWESQRSRAAGEQMARGMLNMDEKRGLAAGLAWAMFNQATDSALLRAAAHEQLESYLLISRRAARDILAACMEPILSGRVAERGAALTQICRDQAQQWLIDLSERGGLLQGEGNDDSLDAPIQFAHKSVQEYLAAQAIHGDESRLRVLLGRWQNDDWREVLLLYAASQQAEPVIRHLLRQGTPKAQLLAGWCLYERPRHAPSVELQDEVRAAVRPLLLASADILSGDENSAALTILEGVGSASLDRPLLEQIAARAISPLARARAVELLAPHLAGDPSLRAVLARIASEDSDARPGLAVGRVLARHSMPDPRGGWVPALVEVPAGPFLMGSSAADEQAQDNEKPQHELTLPTYWIGKMPVTNAQWRRFMDAGGYATARYWTRAGWEWCRAGIDWDRNRLLGWFGRQRTPVQHPRPGTWKDADYTGDNQPVVGISWFEAVAYCRWLSEATGQEFYLPSEAEWEKAARGPHSLIYPWGNEWQDGCCNSEEAGFKRTSPVGSFPAGASPYGALDMAGNVWEWCATASGTKYPYALADEWSEGYLEGTDARCLRGGSFLFNRTFVRGAFRSNRHNPRHRNSSIGLRVASRPPGPDAES